MQEGQTLWTRDQLILAINLYCKLPFGRLSSTTPEIKELAKLLGRTSGSLALKLVNLASLDPVQLNRGIKGMGNASKLDKLVWEEFNENWDASLIESENLLAKAKHTTIEKLNDIDISDLAKEGFNKQRLVKTRVNQCIFRKIVLATYNNKCCITQIDRPELLIAAHIAPWAKNENNRLNPSNGLLLNALHDKAYESGLITITQDYKIKVSTLLKKKNAPESIQTNFIDLDGKQIHLPEKFLPSKEFLKLHYSRFKG